MSALLVGPLLVGLAGSGHCGAMCGGIAATAGVQGSAGRPRLAVPLHVGRLATYAIGGALASGIGAVADQAPRVHEVLAPLRGFTGILLVAMGLALAAGPSALRALDRLGAPLFRFVQPLAARVGGPTTPPRALAFGALWGLLPCGLVYGALALAATTASPLLGAATMLAFGAGTLPALMALGKVVALGRGALARPMMRGILGAAIVLSGVANLGAGWSELSGLKVAVVATAACCRTHR